MWVCNNKNGGDDRTMCGCEAKPAGGTMEKALRGSGCGHQFNFRTGAPLGEGRMGHPVNERNGNLCQIILLQELHERNYNLYHNETNNYNKHKCRQPEKKSLP